MTVDGVTVGVLVFVGLFVWLAINVARHARRWGSRSCARV